MMTEAEVKHTAERLGFELVSKAPGEGQEVRLFLRDRVNGRRLTMPVMPYTTAGDLAAVLCLEAATWRDTGARMAGNDAWLA